MKTICLTLFLLVINSSFAHSGRTDANGGHYDRKTGKYHYHSAPKTTPSTPRTTNTFPKVSPQIARKPVSPPKKQPLSQVAINNRIDGIFSAVYEDIAEKPLGTPADDTVSKRVKKQVQDRDKLKCLICETSTSEIHRLISKEHGGKATLDNLAVMCPSCSKQLRALDLALYEIRSKIKPE